jgi:hypothetical protein
VTLSLLVFFLFAQVSLGLNNGLGRIPQMGMNKTNRTFVYLFYFRLE